MTNLNIFFETKTRCRSEGNAFSEQLRALFNRLKYKTHPNVKCTFQRFQSLVNLHVRVA